MDRLIDSQEKRQIMDIFSSTEAGNEQSSMDRLIDSQIDRQPDEQIDNVYIFYLDDEHGGKL